MIKLTFEEFRSAVKAQGVDRINYAFKCPMCETVQSASDLISASAGADFESVEKYLGFSCVGRFTGAPSPRKNPDGKPCNWTLGGLFKTHKLEVLTPDGKSHPYFEVASPEEVKLHAEIAKMNPTKSNTLTDGDG